MPCIVGDVCVRVNLENTPMKSGKIVGISTDKVSFPETYQQVCIIGDLIASTEMSGKTEFWVDFNGN